jgi:hypothetical protein
LLFSCISSLLWRIFSDIYYPDCLILRSKGKYNSNIFFCLSGEAEAFAIEAKAKAEAEQMAKKAEAWNEYKQAALVDMVLKVLPKLAAEVAGK